MLSWFFARRYLFSPDSRSVVNLISGVSVAAVAMPVAATIVLLSVFNGFESLVRSMYSAFDAELTLTPARGQSFVPAQLDTAALSRIEGVRALSFVLEQSVLAEYDGRQATATLRGVDAAYFDVLPLDGALRGGGAGLGGDDRLVVGQALAGQLRIRGDGECVNLYAVRRGGFSSLLPVANYSRLEIAAGGIFSLDLDTERRYLLAPLAAAQELLDREGRVSALVAGLAPGADAVAAKRAAERIAGPDFRVATRHELRASFYRIMTYEKWGIFCIALLVLVIASFSVVGALAMLVVEKRRDIATLRALGADTSLVRSLFRSEGLLICAWGGAIGAVLGVGASLAQQHLGLIALPADTFLTESYPVEFRPGDLAAVAAAFAAVAFLLSHLTVRSLVKKHPIR